jgi:hypothetical protein
VSNAHLEKWSATRGIIQVRGGRGGSTTRHTTSAKTIISQKYADISFAISASARGDGRGLFNNNRIYI